MIGVAVQKIAADGFIGLLPPNAPLSPEQWKTLTADLVAAVPPVDQFTRVMEAELWSSVVSLDALDESKHRPEEVSSPVTRLPGWMDRERRIYANLMVEILSSVKETGTPQYPRALERPTRGDYMTGETGVVAMMLIPNLGRANEQLNYDRRLMTSLALVSGTRAYLAQHGKLPTSVEQIKSSGIATPDGSLLGAKETQFTSDGKKVTVVADYSLPDSEVVLSKHFPIPAWARGTTKDKIVFEVLARP